MSDNTSFVAAADTVNMQAGGASFFDTASDILTKGVAGSVVSGLYSFVNTGVDLSNKVFGTNIDRADTVNTLGQLDDSYAQYYKEHKDTIDMAGFVAGSLIPGTIAIQGLKAVQAGEAAGAFGRYLGYTTRKESMYLNKALTELGAEGGTIFTRINTSKLASMAWGTADQVLQMAAFETATAVSMKSSPILDDQDWRDISFDVIKSSMIGGVVGGGINALFTNKIMKDAGKLVAGKQREVDILKSIGGVDVSFGDKASSLVEAVLALDKEILDPTVKLMHGRKDLLQSLDLNPLLTQTKKESISRGLVKFQAELAFASVTDKTVGQALSKSLLGLVKDALEGGESKEAIRAKFGDLLYNLKSVEGIAGKPLNVAGELLYLNPKETLLSGRLMTSERQEGDWAYRVIGDQKLATMGTIGKDASSAEGIWKLGRDFALNPATKKIEISPFSTIYEKIAAKDANYTPMFFNTVTKKTTLDMVPTVADIQTAASPLTVNAGGVSSGNKVLTFATNIYNEAPDSITATARTLWASELKKVFGEVDYRDFAVLDALIADPSIAMPGLTIVDRAANKSKLYIDFMSEGMQSHVFRTKYDKLLELLKGTPAEDAVAKITKPSDIVERLTNPEGWIPKPAKTLDLRDVAYRLNVSGNWLEQALSSRLDRLTMYDMEGWSMPGKRYWDRENLLFRYDTAQRENALTFPDALTAYYSRVKEAQSRLVDYSTAALGQKYSALLPDVRESLAGYATGQTAGATSGGASNADYFDKLMSFAQNMGQQVGLIKNERRSDALAFLQSSALRVRQNPTSMTELTAAINAGRRPPIDPVTGKVMSWSIYQDKMSGQWSMVDLGSFHRYLETGKTEFKQLVRLTDETGEFINAFHTLHKERVNQYNGLYAAQGMARNYDPERLHFPPVDTQRVPFFAFVRQTDGSMFGSSDVAMITARDAGELQKKAAEILNIPGFSVQYKDNSEAYFKAKREYDHSMTMNDPMVDSTIRSKGKLGDYMPSFTPEVTMEDFVQYTQRSEGKLVSDLIEAKYAQTVAELKDLSDRYTAGQTSKYEGRTKLLQRAVTDPFGDVIKLMLNISKRSEFTLWNEANEFVDALGTRASRIAEQAFLNARGGKTSWEEANNQLERFGLGRVFRDEDAFLAVQGGQDRNLLKSALHKANSVLAAGMIRLDFLNPLLNIVSTPVMLGMEVSSIRNSLKNHPELWAEVQAKLQEVAPGSTITVPSATRMMANAIASYARGGKADPFLERFKAIGTVKTPAGIFHAIIDDLSLTPNIIPSEYAAKVEKWVERGTTWTGNNLAEEATRYVTSHVMMQITDPLVVKGAMTLQEQNAWMSIFTNRVQGNYIASQRPMIFQGTIGAAIGLFQTYQFNMFQQLFRHIQNKDMKTLAVAGALQGTLFGANGLPFFDAVNSHIIGSASINAGHKDAFSFATQAVGKEYGDWLMYGTASAFPLFHDKAPALWTRGDLNPRSAFMIPTSSADVPAIGASIKVVNAVLGMAKQVSKGSDVRDALLFGLEHNGVNRPLAGLAQVISGNVTTNQGNLIAASGDLASVATFSRLLGAKPMDESIALTTMYRSSAYQAMDKEKLDALGTVVKQKSRRGEPITQEDWIDLQGKYVASGGRIQGFGQALRRWDKAANTSLVDEMMRHSQTPGGQRLNEAMGGDSLPDFSAHQVAP